MDFKTSVAGVITTLLVLSVPIAYADQGAGQQNLPQKESGWHHEDHDKMMAKILNLTDDQVKQLNDQRQKDRDAMKDVFSQMKANKEAFDAEIVKANADMGKINDIQTKIKTLQAQMVDNRLNSILAIKKILSPEQFAGYMALERVKEIMMHKAHHRGNWNKGGDKHWGDKSYKDHDQEGQD